MTQHLREAAAHISRTQKRLGVAVALVLSVGWFVGIAPQRRAAADAMEKHEAVDADYQRAVARADQLPALKAAVEELRRQVGRYKSLRPRSDFHAADAEVARLADEFGLRKFNRETGKPESLDLCIEQPIDIRFEADFEQVFGFIRALESMDRLTRVRGVEITRLDERTGAGGVSVELQLSLFFSEE